MLWFEGGIKSGKLGGLMSRPKKENASEMPLHILDQYPAARSVSRKGRLNGTVNRLNKVNATKIVVISLCENVVLPADPSEETPGKCRKKNAITIAAM